MGALGIPGVVSFCLTWTPCGLVLPLATLTGVAVLVVEAFVTMGLFNGVGFKLQVPLVTPGGSLMYLTFPCGVSTLAGTEDPGVAGICII